MKLRNQAMRVRNNNSESQNPQDPNGTIHDEIHTSSDEFSVSETSRKRKKSIKRPRMQKKKGTSIDDEIDKVGISETSMNIAGLIKRRNGKYGVKIHDRIRKKDVWLGTYESEEEASRVYWAKKEELEKEFQGLALKVSEAKRTSKFVGVSRRASGKFAAHIRDPIRKKKLYLGAFGSEEEASKAYLVKKAELEKEAGKKGVRFGERGGCRRATSLDLRKRRSVGGQCHNQESSMVIDHSDSYDDESDCEIFKDDDGSNSEISKDGDESDSGISNDDDQFLVDAPMQCDDSVTIEFESGQINVGVSEENSLIVEESNEDPCPVNQETLKEESDHMDSSHKEAALMETRVGDLAIQNNGAEEEIDHMDSSHKEAALMGVRVEEDLLIQNNGAEKELIVVDSSVESLVNPDGEILLRTKSGTPLMDCNGYLLGEWSCIDDLSLAS